MKVSQLINEIVSEWAYRVNDGMPDVKNPTHLKELGIVLSEMGLSHIKNDLVENLLMEKGKTPQEVMEVEGNFKNPILNKKISYKDKEGNSKEGIVGNLLRQPEGTPARDAAERVLPPDGSPQRDELNKELGGEGKPKDEEPKDAGGEEGGAPKEDPIQKAAAMYDPKADPAMAARLDKEKEVQAQLAKDAESDKEAETQQEPKEKDEFNPIDVKDVSQEIPQADTDAFGGSSDIPDSIEPKELEQFNTDINKVAQMVKDAKDKGEPAPDINLCQVTVPGTNLYCDDNLGIPRAEMPQFKGKAVPGSRAASMDADASGEVDTEPVFREMLKQKNIKVLQTQVPADKLKATQSELVGAKVVGMMGALEKDPQHPKITAPIYVSRDGYVIDGHHRWAAVVAYNAQHPDAQIQMKTTVIDMDIKDAIPMANTFAEDMGIAAKKADANKETPSDQLVVKQPDEVVNGLKGRKSSEGEDLDIETTENGSMIIGVEHGEGNESTKETINQITSLPKDTKVMFVGEGGMSKDDTGNIDFSGEQKEIRDAVKGHFDNADESSWDENANINDDNSPVFDEVAKSVGGSKSKSKAAIWSNMVGQGDDMNADDYLDDEGKAWLVDQAKKGGSGEFDGDVDWNNLTDEQKNDLYQLNYRDDDGYGETEISKAQQSYNNFRQSELDRKVKEAESQGYKVIAPVGNSHVEAYRKNKSGEEKITQKLPEPEEPSTEDGGVVYSLGGGYYSDTPGGPAQYRVVESIVEEVLLEGDDSFAYLLFEATVTKKTSKGNTVKLKTIDKSNQKKATAVAKAKSAKSKQKKATTVSKDKSVKAKQTKEVPSKSKVSSDKLSSKMEEDDVYFPKKKIADRLKASSEVINKLPMNKNEKQILFGIVGKALKGEDLTKAERKFASDWVTFPATSDPKIYFAPAKGEFKTHISVELGKGIPDREAFNEYLEKNEIFDAGHAVKKKSMVASKLTNKRKPVKVENVVKDKDGNVESCSIGNTTFKRYPEPNENELLNQFKKKGIPNAEEEVRNTLVAIRRHNDYVEFIASQEDIETIDFGYDSDTPDGRKNTIESIKKMMFTKLNSDFGDFFKGKIPPDAKAILNLIKNISNPYNGISPERMQTEIDAIARLMNANPEFRAGVPDMQEIFDFMVKLGQGYAGFMPSASNWKVTDIVTYKPSQEIKIKKGESPAEAIANNFQNIISTSLIEGGLSVKYEKGGASAGYDKVMMTVYKKHKNFDTQKEIITLFDTYKWSFTPGQESRVKSKEEIDAKEAELSSVLQRAKKEGILTDEDIAEIEAEGKAQSDRMAAKVEKKVPFKKYKQCFGKTDKEQKQNYENYKRQCGMWCKMGAIAEKLNNNDMEYQLFGNLRTVYPKKGEPRHETIDGVTTLSGMGWSYDPGIAATGKECKYLSLNNANSSHIEPMKRK